MGFTITGRIRELVVPCEWAWVYSETKQTKIYRRIGSSHSNDQASQTLSDWERMEYGDDGDLDETRER